MSEQEVGRKGPGESHRPAVATASSAPIESSRRREVVEGGEN